MKKLTYAIALCTLLLAGCSQDEAVVENKGELVTLNYNVSLGSGVQSRAEGSDLAVNKLLCVIFEVPQSGEPQEMKRDTVDMTNGTASYSPKLFSNINYRIAFWAYYEHENKSCYDLTDVREIKTNTNYDKNGFEENKYKDAYTAAHDISLIDAKQNPQITLTRPFGMVKVLTTKTDFEAAEEFGSTPATGSLNIGSCYKTYNAYSQEWIGGNESPIELTTSVSTNTVTFQEKECYVLASEYVFGNGTVSTTNLKIKDENGKIIYDTTISNMPLGKNMRTNLYNDALLTGGGVTYSIHIEQGFSDETQNKEI